MLLGCLIAGISAAFSVRWLVGYLSKHGLGFSFVSVCLGVIIILDMFLF